MLTSNCMLQTSTRPLWFHEDMDRRRAEIRVRLDAALEEYKEACGRRDRRILAEAAKSSAMWTLPKIYNAALEKLSIPQTTNLLTRLLNVAEFNGSEKIFANS